MFETSDEIPASLQTSPIVSPATSPPSLVVQDASSGTTLQEPEFLDLATDGQEDAKSDVVQQGRPILSTERRAQSEYGTLTPPFAQRPDTQHQQVSVISRRYPPHQKRTITKTHTVRKRIQSLDRVYPSNGPLQKSSGLTLRTSQNLALSHLAQRRQAKMTRRRRLFQR